MKTCTRMRIRTEVCRVPEKRPDKEGSPSAGAVEEGPRQGERRRDGRGPDTAPGYRRRTDSSSAVALRAASEQSKSVRFTALLHHITILLEQSYLSLERDSAPGIDGVTWQAFADVMSHQSFRSPKKTIRATDTYLERGFLRPALGLSDNVLRPQSTLHRPKRRINAQPSSNRFC